MKKQKNTKGQIVLEIITLLVLIGMYVYLYIIWGSLPDQIPAHYNAAGEINRWGNKTELIVLPVISTFLYLLLSVVLMFPGTWNIPVQVTEENAGRIYRNIKNMMILMKLEIIGMFFFIMYYDTKQQNLSPAFLPVSLLLVFGTMGIYFYRAFRTMSKG